jgi:hypothetical protein
VADIVSGLQQMGGKAVPEGVGSGGVFDTHLLTGFVIDPPDRLIAEGLPFPILVG